MYGVEVSRRTIEALIALGCVEPCHNKSEIASALARIIDVAVATRTEHGENASLSKPSTLDELARNIPSRVTTLRKNRG